MDKNAANKLEKMVDEWSKENFKHAPEKYVNDSDQNSEYEVVLYPFGKENYFGIHVGLSKTMKNNEQYFYAGVKYENNTFRFDRVPYNEDENFESSMLKVLNRLSNLLFKN